MCIVKHTNLAFLQIIKIIYKAPKLYRPNLDELL